VDFAQSVERRRFLLEQNMRAWLRTPFQMPIGNRDVQSYLPMHLVLCDVDVRLLLALRKFEWEDDVAFCTLQIAKLNRAVFS
jgi:hypothetical protein